MRSSGVSRKPISPNTAHWLIVVGSEVKKYSLLSFSGAPMTNPQKSTPGRGTAAPTTLLQCLGRRCGRTSTHPPASPSARCPCETRRNSWENVRALRLRLRAQSVSSGKIFRRQEAREDRVAEEERAVDRSCWQRSRTYELLEVSSLQPKSYVTDRLVEPRGADLRSWPRRCRRARRRAFRTLRRVRRRNWPR